MAHEDDGQNDPELFAVTDRTLVQYLRYLYVRFGGYLSCFFHLKCRVRQGRVLSPHVYTYDAHQSTSRRSMALDRLSLTA